MKSSLPKDWQRLLARLLLLLAFATLPLVASASIITTTFANNNGQSGNMFDINVLAASGINVNALDLNLDAGNWNLQIYTLVGSHVGSESSPGDWTLHDSITGLAGAGAGNATFWDVDDLFVDSGINAFYITVTNGTAMNYTNGTAVGDLIVDDGNLQILQGTGNANNFGVQFRPRIWNGSIHYTVAVPEPGLAKVLAGVMALIACRRQTRSNLN